MNYPDQAHTRTNASILKDAISEHGSDADVKYYTADSYPDPVEEYKIRVTANDSHRENRRNFQPGLCYRCRAIDWSKFENTRMPTTECELLS